MNEKMNDGVKAFLRLTEAQGEVQLQLAKRVEGLAKQQSQAIKIMCAYFGMFERIELLRSKPGDDEAVEAEKQAGLEQVISSFREAAALRNDLLFSLARSEDESDMLVVQLEKIQAEVRGLLGESRPGNGPA